MIRVSSLPLISKCSAAQVAPQVVIRSDDSAARLGTSLHDVMACIVANEMIGGLLSIADLYRVDVDELRILEALGRQAWEGLREYFPNPLIELEFQCGNLSGHPDVVSVNAEKKTIGIIDWKSGRLSGDYEQQLLGYAWLCLQGFPKVEQVFAYVVWIRTGIQEGFTWTRDEVEQKMAELQESLKRPWVYTPGEHCQYCPRSAECPAKTQLLAQAAVALIPWKGSVNEIDRPAKAAVVILEQCKLLEGAIDAARSAIKADVAAAGGRVAVGYGREIVLVEQQRTEIDAEAGWTVLSEIGPRLVEAVDIRKGQLEKVVRDGAERGDKKAAVERLMAKLAQAGALITKDISPKLEVRRTISEDAITTAT